MTLTQSVFLLVYLIGCVCVILELADGLDKKIGSGFWFSLIYVLSSKKSYKYIILSWYFIYKTQ